MKREIPSLITTVMTLVVFASLVLFRLDQLKVYSRIDRMIQYMTAVMMFMGMMNLFRVHTENIRRKRPNWVFSIWLLLVMVSYAAFGMIVGNKNVTYRWLYDALITPIQSTMFATVAFYIVSASYKAFRVKNFEAGLMMVCAIWVMLANVPVGDLIWSPKSFLGGMAGVRDWIVGIPNAAVSRAIGVGTFLGAFATNLRIFLGLERRHLGSG